MALAIFASVEIVATWAWEGRCMDNFLDLYNAYGLYKPGWWFSWLRFSFSSCMSSVIFHSMLIWEFGDKFDQE